MADLKSRIQEEMKSAMRAGDKERLAVIRMILAAIKQVEVDTRTEIDDETAIVVLDKMVKQRRESIAQFGPAGRDDLVAREQAEIGVIQGYLPEPLSAAEVDAAIDEAIGETGATSMKEMGAVMGLLKSKLQGRADMGAVCASVRARLPG